MHSVDARELGLDGMRDGRGAGHRRAYTRGGVLFATSDERDAACTRLQDDGMVAVELEGIGPSCRGRLAEAIDEAIELRLEARGAAAPGIASGSDRDATLSDQLFRARRVGARGIAIVLGPLRAATGMVRALEPEDCATLRFLAAATHERPVALVLDAADALTGGYGDPIPLAALLTAPGAPGAEMLAPERADEAPLPAPLADPSPIRSFVDGSESPLHAGPSTKELSSEPTPAPSPEPALLPAPAFSAKSALLPAPGLPPEPSPSHALPHAPAHAPEPEPEPEVSHALQPAHAPEPEVSHALQPAHAQELSPSHGLPPTPAPEPEVSPAPPRALDPSAKHTAGASIAHRDDPWRTWTLQLAAARGPQPLAVLEKLFAESYMPLANAIAAGLDDPRARHAHDDFAATFSKGYRDAFATFASTTKRPRMVLDAHDVAARIARLHGARSTRLLLVDGMRLDVARMIEERLMALLGPRASLTDELLLWSALPTVTLRQLETIARGVEALRAPAELEEDPEPARGRNAEYVRRMRVGPREIHKLDVVESRVRALRGEVLAHLPEIADAAADAIARHAETLAPRTLLLVTGDHGFTIDRAGVARQGGASPEEVLVGAFALLVGDVH